MSRTAYDWSATRATFEATAGRLLTRQSSPHSDQLSHTTCIERTARDEWRGMPECMDDVYVCTAGLKEWRKPSVDADMETEEVPTYWDRWEWTECDGCGWHAPMVDEYGCNQFSVFEGTETLHLCDACEDSYSRVARERRVRPTTLYPTTPSTEVDQLVWDIVHPKIKARRVEG